MAVLFTGMASTYKTGWYNVFLRDVFEACLSISTVSLNAATALLWQGFQNGVHFFSYSSQGELKLVLCTHKAWSLVSNVLQCSCNVNLLHSLCHAVQHHVNQNVCASSSSAIIAMNDDWAGSSSVALIYLPAEIQQGACGGRDSVSGPAQKVELGQGSGLLGLDIFQVETSYQEVLTPDVLRH